MPKNKIVSLKMVGFKEVGKTGSRKSRKEERF